MDKKTIETQLQTIDDEIRLLSGYLSEAVKSTLGDQLEHLNTEVRNLKNIRVAAKTDGTAAAVPVDLSAIEEQLGKSAGMLTEIRKRLDSLTTGSGDPALGDRLGQLESGLNETLTAMASDLAASNEAIATKLGEGSSSLESKLDKTGASLASKLDETGTSLTSKLEVSEVALTAKLDASGKSLESKLDKTEAALVSKLDKAAGTLQSGLDAAGKSVKSVLDSTSALGKRLEKTEAALTAGVKDSAAATGGSIKEAAAGIRKAIDDMRPVVDGLRSAVTVGKTGTVGGEMTRLAGDFDTLAGEVKRLPERLEALAGTLQELPDQVTTAMDGRISTFGDKVSKDTQRTAKSAEELRDKVLNRIQSLVENMEVIRRMCTTDEEKFLGGMTTVIYRRTAELGEDLYNLSENVKGWIGSVEKQVVSGAKQNAARQEDMKKVLLYDLGKIGEITETLRTTENRPIGNEMITVSDRVADMSVDVPDIREKVTALAEQLDQTTREVLRMRWYVIGAAAASITVLLASFFLK